MAKLEKLIQTNNEVDPLTGLQYTRRGNKYTPIPTEANYIAANLGQQEFSVPMQNLAIGLPSLSKYDEDISSEQLEYGRLNPQALEESRSENQSAGRAALFALGKGLAKTGVNVIGGTVGTAYGIGSALANGSFSNLYDNSVINELDSWSKGLDLAMPVYKNREYESDNLLENIIKNPVMFMDSATDAISFTAGALLTGYLTAGVGSYFRVANAVNKLNKGVFVSTAARFGVGAENMMSKASSIANIKLADDMLGNARRIITGSAYEAAVEANGMAQEMRAKAIPKIDAELEAKYKPLFEKAMAMDTQAGIYGNMLQEGQQGQQSLPNYTAQLKKLYDEERSQKLLQLEEYVQKAGNANYVNNLAILSTSNAMQFAPTFGMRWTGARKILPNSIRDAAKAASAKSAQIAIPEATGITKALGVAKNVLEKPVTEGLFEEGLQGASSEAMQDYYLRKYDPKNFGEARELLESVANGIGETYGTNQGWKEIGMGMLIGGIGAPGKGLLPGKFGINEDTGERESIWTGGIKGSFDESRKKQEAIDRAVKEYNEKAANTTLGMQAGMQNAVTDMAAKRQSDKGIKTDDKKTWLDAKDDSYFGFVRSREMAGVGETIDNEIEAAKKMTPDEFIATYAGDQSESVSSPEDKAKFQKETIQELEDKTNKIRESLKMVNRIEPSDPINNYVPELEDYKEQLAYLLSKGELIDYRQDQLKAVLDNLSNNVVSGDEVKAVTRALNEVAAGSRLDIAPAMRAKKKAAEKEAILNTKKQEFEEVTTKTKEKIQKQFESIDELTSKKEALEKELADSDAALKSVNEQFDKLQERKRKKLEKATTEELRKEVNEAYEEEAKNLNITKKQLEEERSNTEKNLSNQVFELSKQNKVLKGLNEEFDKASTEHLEATNNLTSQINEHKKLYKDTLEKKQLLAKAAADKRGVEFKWDNFEEYSKEIDRVWQARAELEQKLKELPVDTLKRQQLMEAFEDMNRLENSRQEAIELLNYFLTPKGKERAALQTRKFQKEIFMLTMVREKEIEDKVNEIISDPRYNNGGIPFTYVYKGKRVNGFVMPYDKDGESIPVFTTENESDVAYSKEEVVDGKTVTRDFNTVRLDKIIELTYAKAGAEPQVTDAHILTAEEEVKKAEEKEIEKSLKVDTKTGTVEMTGKLLEDAEGNQYLEATKKAQDGSEYTVLYEVEDDTVQPRQLSKAERPTDLKEVAASKTFRVDGKVATYTDSKGVDKTVLVVKESPFIPEELAEDLATYPKELNFVVGNISYKVDKKDIPELVDRAKAALDATGVPLDAKTGRPILTYNGMKGYLDYHIKIKTLKKHPTKYKDKKTGKTRYKKQYVYLFPGEKELILWPIASDTLTSEQLKEAIDNGTLTADMIGDLNSNKRETGNTYDLRKEGNDIVMDGFISKMGEEYVIVSKDGNYYAVKKETRIYYINEGQLGSHPVTFGKDLLDKLVYASDEFENELGKNEFLQKDETLGAKIDTLYTVAGKEVMGTKTSRNVPLADGKTREIKYWEDTRDVNGVLVFNPDDSQRRWYNFLKNRFATVAEFEEFKKNHKLKIVVNTLDGKQYFGTDEFDTTGLNSDGTFKESSVDNFHIKVIIVDKDGNPIEVDGNVLINSLHDVGYTGLADKDNQAELREDFKKLRELILAEINAAVKGGSDTLPELYLEIANMSTGRTVKEPLDILESGYARRQRLSVEGRLIESGKPLSGLKWGVVTSSDDATQALIIDGLSLENRGNLVGHVVTAVKGANGKGIAVNLLTRNLSTEEATTVVALIKMGANALKEGKEAKFEGVDIFPNFDTSIGQQDFYLKRFIRYGRNKKNLNTQIFYDSAKGILTIGTTPVKLADLNTADGFAQVVKFLVDNKIHHVSEAFKGKEFTSTVLSEDGSIIRREEYDDYNDYLFGSNYNGTSRTPVLATDIVAESDGKPLIVQPNIEAGNLYAGEKVIKGKKVKPSESKKSTKKEASTSISTGNYSFEKGGIPLSAVLAFEYEGTNEGLRRLAGATETKMALQMYAKEIPDVKKRLDRIYKDGKGELKKNLNIDVELNDTAILYILKNWRDKNDLVNFFIKEGIIVDDTDNSATETTPVKTIQQAFTPPAVTNKTTPTTLGFEKLGDIGNQGLAVIEADILSRGKSVINVSKASTEQLDKIKRDVEELKVKYPNKNIKSTIENNTLTIFTTATKSNIFNPSTTDAEITTIGAEVPTTILNKDDFFSDATEKDPGNTKARLVTTTPTQIENIQEVKNWFARVLPNVPLEVVNNIITTMKGGAWGVFTGHAVKLYKGAEIGTGYHEAWHVVSSIGIPKSQLSRLYNAVRKERGKGITDAEAEEILAEDFRTWMLTGKSELYTPNTTKRNVFQQLLDFIKSIIDTFTGNDGFKNLINIYKDIDMGSYNHIRTDFSDSPVNEWLPRVAGLDAQQSEDLVSGIAVQVMRVLYDDYKGDILNFGNNVDKIIKDTMFGYIKTTDSFKKEASSYNAAKTVIESNPRMVANKIKEFLSYYGLAIDTKAKDIANEAELSEGTDETLSIEEQANRANEFANSNETSNLESMPNEIKLIIGTLFEKTTSNEGRLRDKLNSVGLPKIVDFSTAYAKVLDTLAGTSDWDTMMKKLKGLAKKHPEYDELVKRLDTLEPGSNNELHIKPKFRQAMSINRYDYHTYVINENGGRFVQSSMSRTIDRLREQLDASYKSSPIYKRSINASDVAKFNEDLRKTLAHVNDWKLASIKSNEDRLEEARKILADFNFLDVISPQTLLEGINFSNFLNAMIDVFNNKALITDLTVFKMGKLNGILATESLNRKEFFEPSHLNAKNKTQYEFSLNNYYTTVVNTVLAAMELDTYESRLNYLFNKLPHLKSIKDVSAWFKQIDLALKSGNIMPLKVSILEGMRENVSGAEGEITFDLSKTDLFKMHIEAALRSASNNQNSMPIYTLRRPSDKSLEYGITGFNPITVDNYTKHFPNYVQWDLDTTGLQMFGEILGKDLVTLIKSQGISKPEIREKIYKAFMQFLEEEYNKNLQYAKDLKLIHPKGHLFSKELMGVRFKSANDVIRAYTNEYFISRVEQHMLFLGDFKQFKQLFKRTSGPTGTKKTFSNDRFILDKLQSGYVETLSRISNPKSRLDLILKLPKSLRESLGLNDYLELPETSGSTNIVILKDIEKPTSSKYLSMYRNFIKSELKKDGLSDKDIETRLNSYMKPYNEMNVADGLGYISLDQYREWMIEAGEWDLKIQEPVYQKIINGEKVSIEDVAIFPTIKPQGFGPKAYKNLIVNGKVSTQELDKVEMAFAKLSLMPLIPTVIAGTDLEKLDTSMKLSGANVAIYPSGLKDTNNKVDAEDFFNNTNVRMLKSFNQSDQYWGIQVDMHTEIEESDIDGTQQRAQLWQDLFDGGVPLDYTGTAMEWANLGEITARKESHIYDKYAEYSETYKNLIELSKAKLLKDLGIVEEMLKDGSLGYKVNDRVKFINEIKKQVATRRLPENLLDALGLDENGKSLFPLDALALSDKIENILFAMATNNTIKIKRPGAAYVQTSSALWRSESEKLGFIEITQDGKKIKAAEVMLPNYMRGLIGDNVNLDKIDQRLLKLVGYRIPTQGQNSMLPMVVKGFLPAEFGDTIVVPWEIVAQSGSDFDIDKLHVFRPNFIKIDGKLKYLDATVTKESLLEEVKAIEELLTKPQLIGEKLEQNAYNKFLQGIFQLEEADYKLEKEYLNKLIYNRLEKMQLENKLLEIQLDILSNPLVGRNLLVPNGADFLKEEAAFTEWLTTGLTGVSNPGELSKDNPKFQAWAAENKASDATGKQLLSAKYELETGMTFKLGKKMVAIFANYSKFHTLCQQSKVSLTGVIHKPKWVANPNGDMTDVGSDDNLILNFDYNKDSSGKPALGKRLDTSKSPISELQSQLLTASVDIAKDPFIFRLNVNSLTSNVVGFLAGVGASREFINRFLTQPIVMDYIEERLRNESITIESTRGDRENSPYESEEQILKKLYTKYGNKIANEKDFVAKEEFIKSTKTGVNYTPQKLNSDILTRMLFLSNNLSTQPTSNVTNYYKTQTQVLGDFLNYLEYGKAFSDGVQSVKPDTKRLKNMSDATTLLENIDLVNRSKFFNGIDNLRNRGLLASFNSVHADFMKKLYGKEFITEKPFIQSNIYYKIKQNAMIGSNTRLTEKEVDKIRQGVMTYLLLRAIARYKYGIDGELSKEQFEKMLVGPNSIPRQYHEMNKNESNESLTNFIFSKLGEDTRSVDMLKIQGKKVDPATANVLSEAIDKLGKEAWEAMFIVNTMQTGYVYSPVNFMKYLNSKKVAEIFSPIINNIDDSNYGKYFNNFDKFITDFLLINRKNKKFVPTVYSGKLVNLEKDGDVLKISNGHTAYGKKVVKMVEKQITKRNGEDMTVYYDVTYKLEAADAKTATYIKITPKGNFFLQEYHSGNESIDSKNLIDKNTISDSKRATLVKDIGTIRPEAPVVDESNFTTKISDTKMLPANTATFNYARYSGNNYEVSSKGDTRFSAFNAILKTGKSIESTYQSLKGSGKGQPAKDKNFDYWGTYLDLWKQWALENPKLITELYYKATGKTLTDQFANTDNNQARALAHILNTISNSGGIEKFNSLDSRIKENIIKCS